MEDILKKYEMTIGIECHVQLKTKTKLFSGSDNDAREKSPNEATSPIDFGLPGMLPVLNKEAVRLAVRAGKALNAKIANMSRFDRKHYFYPDLPKGYQTSQLYHPIIGEGEIIAPLPSGGEVKVRIEHAHLEEDAGKLTHHGDYSLVDLNRAGTPLIEIVSMPDIHSAEEARAYAEELHKRMVFAGVTDGDLYQGNMRFDVNISARKFGEEKLGTRTEIKNLNSFRSVERAAQYEFERQVKLLEKGEKIKQETRGWLDDEQKTVSQRSKEEAQDYRYMPDPDIPPIILSDEEISKMQAQFSIMPDVFRKYFAVFELDNSVIEYALSDYRIAELLLATWGEGWERPQSELFNAAEIENYTLEEHKENMKRMFNWFASTPAEEIDLDKVHQGYVGPRRLTLLAHLVHENKISSNGGKEIFLALFEDENLPKMPEEIAKERNLLQVSNEGAIAKIVDEVLADAASQKAIEDIRNGNDKAIGFLVGQIMKKSQGKANPALAQKLIRERL
ncbi:MAG: Asp-tRNA(Asn)/Glu-tRNA(Gln) amidotransferase subunit GatB [bacterium]|nr:Asp-tRNA(Asn)/Glu-tRNA(Gln) amidotransferase subunit GatB [bacterium]